MSGPVTRSARMRENPRINIYVLGTNDEYKKFEIGIKTPLRKLLASYCTQKNLALTTSQFHFNGIVIDLCDTASSLEMKDGDTIKWSRE